MGNKAAKNASWKPDKAVSKCEICDVVFSLLTRRHHCRSCGGIFCDTCSKDRAIVPRKTKFSESSGGGGATSSGSPSSDQQAMKQFERVCGVCYLKLDVSKSASQGNGSPAGPYTPRSADSRQSGTVKVNRRRGSDVGISRLTVAPSPSAASSSAPPPRAL